MLINFNIPFQLLLENKRRRETLICTNDLVPKKKKRHRNRVLHFYFVYLIIIELSTSYDTNRYFRSATQKKRPLRRSQTKEIYVLLHSIRVIATKYTRNRLPVTVTHIPYFIYGNIPIDSALFGSHVPPYRQGRNNSTTFQLTIRQKVIRSPAV